MYKRFIKRLMDILLSLLAMIALSPVYLLVAIFARIFIGPKIIFKQLRIGKNDKRFYIYKFRTMTDERDNKGELLPDEQRKTRFGELLRSTSLDELPELWNIFVGDMSIIGPRPLLEGYLDYYTDSERKRHLVRGGLVPPEVITLNLTPSWDEQLASEAEYAQNVSFLLDLKIFFSTFVVLYKRVRYGYGEYVRQPLSVERKKSEEEITV